MIKWPDFSRFYYHNIPSVASLFLDFKSSFQIPNNIINIVCVKFPHLLLVCLYQSHNYTYHYHWPLLSQCRVARDRNVCGWISIVWPSTVSSRSTKPCPLNWLTFYRIREKIFIIWIHRRQERTNSYQIVEVVRWWWWRNLWECSLREPCETSCWFIKSNQNRKKKLLNISRLREYNIHFL